MKTWIYRSSRREGLYLYLAREGDFDCVARPIMERMGDPRPVMELELTPDRKLAREDVNVVCDNLRTIGYHLQLPPGEDNWASWDNVKAGIRAGRGAG
ncbi:MAG: YcgL domain-containing protein [Halothiobacillaceae bacterium]